MGHVTLNNIFPSNSSFSILNTLGNITCNYQFCRLEVVILDFVLWHIQSTFTGGTTCQFLILFQVEMNLQTLMAKNGHRLTVELLY